jgi:hypothetical protein
MLQDFLRYLQSYEWNIRRTERGYDLILVDEYHLFSSTERQIIDLLTRNPDSFPSIVVAIDARQSAYARMAGIASASDRREVASESTLSLDVSHRFAPQVFEFITHLHNSFPSVVDLGEDWTMVSVANGSSTTGSTPSLKSFNDPSALLDYAFRTAAGLLTAKYDRVAVIGVELSDLSEIIQWIDGRGGIKGTPITLLSGREDVESLRYNRRSVAVSCAEFSAGLQFGYVIVVSLGGTDGPQVASARRALASDFYLACSRAESGLEILRPRSKWTLDDLLLSAISAGVLVDD